MKLVCPKCGRDVEILDPWDQICNKFNCKKCRTSIVLEFDETCDMMQNLEKKTNFGG